MSETTKHFSTLRAFLWPVHRHELKKLIPMMLILFLLTLDYNILRTMKDTLVVATGKGGGAHVIPFVKVWAMFPGSILLTFIFTRMSNVWRREKVFYWMLSLFLGFFVLFVLILYPFREILHPDGFADFLQANLWPGMGGFVAMIRNWTFTSFYAMSELWSNIILFLLFWNFANQVTHFEEAKRFYAILGVATNLSGVFAGGMAIKISQISYQSWLPYGYTPWDQQMFILLLIVVTAGVVALSIFRWLHTHVLDKPTGEPVKEYRDELRGKMSMRENFRYLFQSRYLLCIAIIAIGYNMVINLVEVLWKDQVFAIHSDSSDYSVYMNQVTMIIGLIATFASLFVSGNLIRSRGWTTTAMVTPIILFVTSIGFFGALFAGEHLAAVIMGFLGMSPVALAAFFGTLQNYASRGAKYTVYDTTKEMAFVPLDQESKVKGKAAIDGVCNRMGKSGGAVILQTLLVIFSTLSAIVPYVACAVFIIILIWMGAVFILGRKFNALTAPAKPNPPTPATEPLLQGQA